MCFAFKCCDFSLQVLLQRWCSTGHLVVQAWSPVYTARKNRERPDSGICFKIFDKNTILNEQPVYSFHFFQRFIRTFEHIRTKIYSSIIIEIYEYFRFLESWIWNRARSGTHFCGNYAGATSAPWSYRWSAKSYCHKPKLGEFWQNDFLSDTKKM